MLRAVGRRLTYANVIASLALFLALGAKLIGGPRGSSTSTATVAVAVTQLK